MKLKLWSFKTCVYKCSLHKPIPWFIENMQKKIPMNKFCIWWILIPKLSCNLMYWRKGGDCEIKTLVYERFIGEGKTKTKLHILMVLKTLIYIEKHKIMKHVTRSLFNPFSLFNEKVIDITRYTGCSSCWFDCATYITVARGMIASRLFIT